MNEQKEAGGDPAKGHFERYIVKLVAKNLARELYRGILGREADPEGLGVAIALIQSNGDISKLAETLVCSPEFQKKSFLASAPKLVTAAYKGILDRDPDAEGFKVHTSELKSEDDIPAFLKGMAGSHEFTVKSVPLPEFQNTILPILFPSGVNLVATKVLDRYMQWIDLHDRYVSLGCMTNNWEPNETTYFSSRLKDADTVLDIGANIGWFTLVAASHVGKNGRIHSFEPRPATAALLKRTVTDNELQDQVTVWEYALWDTAGSLDLFWGGPINPGGSQVIASSDGPPIDIESAKVASSRLDDLLPDIAPDLIKIDIEGAEPKALHGAKNAISRKKPPILSELHPSQLKRISGVTVPQYISQMAGFGYSCFLLEEGRPTKKLTDFPADIGEDLVSVVFECVGPVSK